eukprot:3906407-Pyramimonas_sp.AAC.1
MVRAIEGAASPSTMEARGGAYPATRDPKRGETEIHLRAFHSATKFANHLGDGCRTGRRQPRGKSLPQTGLWAPIQVNRVS